MPARKVALNVSSPVILGENLLEFVCTVEVPEAHGLFIAKDGFKRRISPSHAYQINFISAPFKERFLKGRGKVEQGTGACTLDCYRLLRATDDLEILGVLGGEERVATRLRGVYYLGSLQGKGEEGGVLQVTHGGLNAFYCTDVNAALCTVHMVHTKSGWSVGATPPDDKHLWPDGTYIFVPSGTVPPVRKQ